MRQGGFAMIAGDPGTGKSVALRLLAHRLEHTEGLGVAVLTHPSASVADFYHELADLFAVTLVHNNRWLGFKGLRQHWRAHLDDIRLRPLLLVDEAQELGHAVLTEMRLLASTEFDSRSILSVVLVGDNRLVAKLRNPDLLPIASRIRQRLLITRCEPRELARLLDHLLEHAGNPALDDARAQGHPRRSCRRQSEGARHHGRRPARRRRRTRSRAARRKALPGVLGRGCTAREGTAMKGFPTRAPVDLEDRAARSSSGLSTGSGHARRSASSAASPSAANPSWRWSSPSPSPPASRACAASPPRNPARS